MATQRVVKPPAANASWFDGVPSKRLLHLCGVGIGPPQQGYWDLIMDTFTAALHPSSTADSPLCVPPSQLAATRGLTGAARLLDVRRSAAFEASPRMLAGALHVPGDDLAALDAAASQMNGPMVLACVYGHAVSQGAATHLRQAGHRAQALAGGVMGGQDGVDSPEAIAQWRAHAVPTVLKRPDWGVTGRWADPPSRWVTRERPRIDRLACPWLLRRWIDPRAEIIYVPATQVLSYAAQTGVVAGAPAGAIAFDIVGAPVTHVGELCSFDALLNGFDLHDPALDLLATIVRGADTDRPDLHPASAGLVALSLGLAAMHTGDDHALLAAAMPMYDALYKWCADSVQGQAEHHTWVVPEAAAGATRA